VFPQYLDFHIHLVRDHRRLKSANLLSTRCINFQSLACINLHPLLTAKSGLLRSTGKTGQKLVIAVTPFTPEIPVPGYLENYLGWFRALDRSPGFNPEPASLLAIAVRP
jgi:hypothetical protein